MKSLVMRRKAGYVAAWSWSLALDIRMIPDCNPTMVGSKRSLLLQESVDVFEIVQAIVYEELEFGDDAKLMAHALAEFKTNGGDIAVDVGHNLFAAFRGEYAEIGAANAHVGADIALAHRNECASHRFGL